MTQRTLPLPRRGGFTWTVALIVALGAIALLAIGVAVGTLLNRRTSPAPIASQQQSGTDADASAPPAASSQEQAPAAAVAPDPAIIAAFRPRSFTTVPANPTTPEEMIAAIYLRAKEGLGQPNKVADTKLIQAISIAPAADREVWREHLEWLLKDAQDFQNNRKRRMLVPGFSEPGIAIVELYPAEGNCSYWYVTSLSHQTGEYVCVTMGDGGEVTQLRPD